MDWITHEEDVWFDFRGNDPRQLTAGRFYRGTVDGFADFGVFIDLARGVTGLLHRSELDTRLESLDWDPGDTVFVQVKNVRDNGDIDLAWSIRQSESEFRGARIDDPDADGEPKPFDSDDDDDGPVRQRPSGKPSPREATRGENRTNGERDDAGGESTADAAESEETDSSTDEAAAASDDGPSTDAGDSAEGDEPSATDVTDDEPSADEVLERVTVDSLSDRVGDVVRIEGEVVSARQTSGPTVFEVRDETGVVDCAAFVEAGVRAYPDVEVGDLVRLDGEVERRRDELQVETEALDRLADDDAATVMDRLDAALDDAARPESVEPLAPHAPVEGVAEPLLEAATAVRRAVLESRPVVVRHVATADGYVAGAAIERAVLPLVREEHATAAAEYHYFDRRPLEDSVYDMDAATKDATRMLQDRDRHDEKLPLVLLVGAGSTVESADGLGLLGVYGAERVVVDAAAADAEIESEATAVVNPGLAGVDEADLSTGALAATLAATVNADVRDDVRHLPAVSYWEDAPEAYTELAAEAGYHAERVAELREAVALEAYYQSYEDKRELIADLLFGEGEAASRGEAEPEDGDLAAHISEQFRSKLEDEVETAEANLERRDADGVGVAVIDTDAFTHRFDFPPTDLLVDELHRRNREGDFVTVGVGTDKLSIRATTDLDVRAVTQAVRETVPEGGVHTTELRVGRIGFLSGMRDDVVDAAVDAAVEQVD
jgi:RecJ-like exonuclease